MTIDIDELNGIVIRQGSDLSNVKRDVDQLYREYRSLRLYLQNEFAQIRKDISALGQARDEDSTAVRAIKTSIRKGERKRANIQKAMIAIGSPILVEILRHFLRW